MKELLKKHGEIIRYIFFGVVTTAVSFFVYFAILAAAESVFSLDPAGSGFYIVRLVAQVLQWIAGVLVAFFTNKKWVFRSKSENSGQTLREFGGFTASRVGTLLLDTALTMGVVWLAQTLQYQPFTLIIEFTADVWAKGIASVAVIIANYIISKYFVFNKKG